MFFHDLVGDNNDDTSCRRPPTLMTTLGVASLYLLINVWGICVHAQEEINRYILLLESPCPFVRSLVTKFTAPGVLVASGVLDAA